MTEETLIFISRIEKALGQNNNPVNAAPMKKYMKNQFDFFGIQSGMRRSLCKPFLRKNSLPPVNQLKEIVCFLWQKPQREFQYFAMELTEKYIKGFDVSHIDLIEFMLVNKSWWDTVDMIAAKIAGPFMMNHQSILKTTNERWINSGNIWLQRTTLLYQLKYKSRTDKKLLFENIMHLADSKEFFIRKAIGWSLREYSKINPGEVEKFVASKMLSPLSRREALKQIRKSRAG